MVSLKTIKLSGTGGVGPGLAGKNRNMANPRKQQKSDKADDLTRKNWKPDA